MPETKSPKPPTFKQLFEKYKADHPKASEKEFADICEKSPEGSQLKEAWKTNKKTNSNNKKTNPPNK